MAKTKTKKEEVIDLKPEKITDEQLKEIQGVIDSINRAQLDMGILETKKHHLLHVIAGHQDTLSKKQTEFEKEYGTADINIQDGTINYAKENGEVNKED
tara:strand:+ start:836 stop:1132 length:297 start_codon:yes stop_codon:yes gene_type:complete